MILVNNPNNRNIMIKVYHNPQCSKSRESLKYLDEHNKEYEVINYMKNPISVSELKLVIEKLGIKPIELVRQKETIWKENYKGKELSDEEIVTAMIENPRLIERPIIVTATKAVIARPTEKIDLIF